MNASLEGIPPKDALATFAQEAPSTRVSWQERTRLRDYALVVLIALASRGVIFLVAAASRFGAAEDGRLASGNLTSLFVSWDSAWYLRIVAYGYDAPTLTDYLSGTAPHAFFPVFPLLIRSMMMLTGLDAATSGAWLATALFVAGLCLIYAYVLELGLPSETGIMTVLLLCCAPHSFVFAAAYPESTFVALLAAAMLALRKRRYALAGIAAALLSGTRPNGVLAVVFILAWALRHEGWDAVLRPWRAPGPMLAAALAPLGLVAYWWFCYLTTGDAFAQKTAVLHGWYWSMDWPWTNIARHLAGTATDVFWAAGSLLYFAASLTLLRYRMWEEFAYCFASFLLAWSIVMAPSLIRYAVVLFPIHIGLARAVAGRPLLGAALASAFAMLNGFLVVAFVSGWRIAV